MEVDVQVLVVGDGLSAADAVIRCIGNGVRVHHVFRRSARELKCTSVRECRMSRS